MTSLVIIIFFRSVALSSLLIISHVLHIVSKGLINIQFSDGCLSKLLILSWSYSLAVCGPVPVKALLPTSATQSYH